MYVRVNTLIVMPLFLRNTNSNLKNLSLSCKHDALQGKRDFQFERFNLKNVLVLILVLPSTMKIKKKYAVFYFLRFISIVVRKYACFAEKIL